MRLTTTATSAPSANSLTSYSAPASSPDAARSRR